MIEMLAKFDVLSELGDNEREELSFFLENREVEEGTWLFRSEDEANELFLVAEGGIEIQSAGRPIGVFGPGEVVGAMSPIVVGRRECDARAAEESVVFVLSREAYFRVSVDQPGLALKLTEGVLRSVAGLARAALVDRRTT